MAKISRKTSIKQKSPVTKKLKSHLDDDVNDDLLAFVSVLHDSCESLVSRVDEISTILVNQDRVLANLINYVVRKEDRGTFMN